MSHTYENTGGLAAAAAAESAAIGEALVADFSGLINADVTSKRPDVTYALPGVAMRPPFSPPTASQLERARACTASMVLPRVRDENPSEARDRGLAVHKFLEEAAALAIPGDQGRAVASQRDYALRLVPEEYRPFCEAIDLEAMEQFGSGAAELQLAWNPETDEARWVPVPEEVAKLRALGWVTGRADWCAVNVEAEVGIVRDYKTGRDGKPAGDDEQMQFLALALARAYGLDEVVVEKLYLKESGDIGTSRATLGEMELDATAGWVRAMLARGQKAHVALPTPPPATMGEWCKYCPCFTYCPAATGLVRQMATDPGALYTEVNQALDKGQARIAYERWQQAKLVMGEVAKVFYGYSRVHPIDLGDGMVFGPVATSREKVDGEAVWRLAEEQYGPEVAKAMVTPSSSKTAIDRALREAWPKFYGGEGTVREMKMAAAGGVTRKAMVEDFLSRLRDAGGISTTHGEEVKEHKA